MSTMPCRCTDRDCFQWCDCYTKWMICSPDCYCHGGCLNNVVLRWSALQPQGTAPTLASGSSTAQGTSQTQPSSSAAQAAAQTLPSSSVVAALVPDTKTKPLPEREPGNTSQLAVKTNFVNDYGCACRTNKCQLHWCPCYMRKIRCTSKCTCLATVCVNPFGLRGDESSAEPGGQRGTSGTPDRGTSQMLASGSSTAQGTSQTQPSSSAAQAAAQTLPSSSVVAALVPDTKTKPLPEREPGNTSQLAVKTNFVNDYGCACRTNKCQLHWCPCYMRKIRCTSKCTCLATVCVNPFGLRGDESSAEPGGQRGTSGTPDRGTSQMLASGSSTAQGTSQTQPSSSAAQAAAQTLPSSSVVAALVPDTKTKPLPEREPGNTSQLAVKTNFVNDYGCACRTNKCQLHWCPCYMRKIRCTSKCTCLATVCVNPFGLRGDESSAEPGGQRGTSGTPDRGTSQMLASGSSTAQGTSQTQPSSSAAQAAAQTLPSSSVVAALMPDTKTKPLPAREPGSTQDPCRCDKSKCGNMECGCVKAGLPCCDLCECKDCDNTKTSEEKLQDLFEDLMIKRELPASGSGTSTMTMEAALAAKKSAKGCKCQSECASRCGCVKRNIKCTSKCKCKYCNKDEGSRFPKEGPGGQGGTHSSSSAVESAGKHG